MKVDLKKIVYFTIGIVLTVWAIKLAMTLLISGALDEPSAEEKLRVTSPDGTIDAVFMEENYHATVPFVGKLYLVAKDQVAESNFENVRVSDYQSIQLVWHDDNSLLFCFEEAEFYHFNSHSHKFIILNGGTLNTSNYNEKYDPTQIIITLTPSNLCPAGSPE